MQRNERKYNKCLAKWVEVWPRDEEENTDELYKIFEWLQRGNSSKWPADFAQIISPIAEIEDQIGEREKD
jgi:hypothetical protein